MAALADALEDTQRGLAQVSHRPIESEPIAAENRNGV